MIANKYLNTLTSEEQIKFQQYQNDNDFIDALDIIENLNDFDFTLMSKNYAVLVFTPAAIITNKLKNGLDKLTHEGFSLSYYKTFFFTEEQIRRIWKYQLETFTEKRWKEIVSVLTIGPSMLCILCKQSINEESASMELKLIKGVSDPILIGDNTLRRSLGAMNKVINMVHSSDDTICAIRESYIILGSEGFKKVLANLHKKNYLIEEIDLIILSNNFNRAEFINTPIKVASSIRYRLMCELFLYVERNYQINQIIREEIQWLMNIFEIINHSDFKKQYLEKYSKNYLILTNYFGEVQCTNQTTAESCKINIIINALYTLNKFLYTDDLIDLENLMDSFEKSDTYISDWERLVINTEEITKKGRLNKL